VARPDMTHDLIAINSMLVILFISARLEPETYDLFLWRLLYKNNKTKM